MSTSADPDDQNPAQEQGFVSHLVELRDRLLKIVLAVGVCFIVLFPFSDTIYSALAEPLLRHMPEGSNMIAIDVASPFLIPFKVVLMLSVFVSVPFILYQVWAFVAPGLYSHEQRLVRPLLVSSTLLFYLGVSFAYFVVFPLVFGFFTSIAPEGVEVSTDIGRYLDFVITLFFAFGLAFEVPIATILLVMTGVTTAEALAEKRPYFIVAAFVVGMFLTPPDIISQTLLALPMWLLFELGIFFSRFFINRVKEAGIARETILDETASTTTTAQQASATETASASVARGDEGDYQPPTDDEMEAELDRIEAEEAADDAEKSRQNPEAGGSKDPTP
ncbi:MAG TPA: twin-arginine translocase subunit TatC [Gammaproteobacteria bacterium]|jgi:sec-independent protein translocase protein TatC|nr:twin-arginine translocase subunit TatC [Gammaproteobacteria bacterium]